MVVADESRVCEFEPVTPYDPLLTADSHLANAAPARPPGERSESALIYLGLMVKPVQRWRVSRRSSSHAIGNIVPLIQAPRGLSPLGWQQNYCNLLAVERPMEKRSVPRFRRGAATFQVGQ